MESYQIYILIAVGVFLFIGASIATGSAQYFNDTVKKVMKKDRGSNSLGMTAGQFANEVMKRYNLQLTLARTPGKFKDFYSSKNKMIAISDEFIESQSMTAIGVVAHELGHAIDDNQRGLAFRMRQFFIRFAKALNVFFWLAIVAAIVLFIINATEVEPLENITYNQLGFIMLYVAAGFFGLIIFIKLLTAKTETNASKIAVSLLKEFGFTAGEIKKVKKVLRAAFLTYVGDIFMPLIKLFQSVLWILSNTIGRLFGGFSS
jgi:Zn-dependent membrane protease YugP